MDTTVAVERDAPVTPVEIPALRVAVGWDADEASYVKSLKRFHAHYTVRIEGRLVGFLAVVSDGVSNALLGVRRSGGRPVTRARGKRQDETTWPVGRLGRSWGRR